MEIEQEISAAEDWYPTFDAPRKPDPVIGKPEREQRLRSGLTPGTVVILLAGRFKGRRMIFLKQLEPGFLLLNGPYCVNKVPLLKMRQDYVIVTSTKIDIPNVDLSDIDMTYFEKPRKAKKDSTQAEFFQTPEEEKPKLTEAVIATQKRVDDALMPSIDAEMVEYLRTLFTLHSGDRPHLMTF